MEERRVHVLIKRRGRGLLTLSAWLDPAHQAVMEEALARAVQIYPTFDRERFRHALREARVPEQEIERCLASVAIDDEVYLG